jgi:hypothetical protein
VDEPSPARNPDVVHSRLAGGETVLLHLESGEYHELNPVGAEIWDLLDGDRTTSEITGELRHRVDDPPEDLRVVVEDYLEELRGRDLLR